MLVEIFEGLFVRADHVEGISVKGKKVEFEVNARSRASTYTPAVIFDNEEQALQHARDTMHKVNSALKGCDE